MATPDRKLTKPEQAALEALGWGFFQYGPNEWQWVKFVDSKKVAVQGDAVWAADVAAASMPDAA